MATTVCADAIASWAAAQVGAGSGSPKSTTSGRHGAPQPGHCGQPSSPHTVCMKPGGVGPSITTTSSFDGLPIEGWLTLPPGYTPGTRVPLILRVPRGAPGLPEGTAAGGVCDRPVSLTDLYATLCELCGLTPPPK